MEYVANFMNPRIDPVAWARRREAEGWQLLGCADHLWSDSGAAFPHAWVTLGAMAAITSRPRLTSSFANNLLRSPVEFASAALQVQSVSGGRFEAGLGAGWSSSEIVGIGHEYPTPAERAGRYREAIEIARTVLSGEPCRFEGEHYRIDSPALVFRPDTPRPPLVASLGGPRTIREVAPLVDRVELKLISSATRQGALDVAALAEIPRSHLTDLVARVRAVNETVPIGVFILCSVGEDRRTMAIQEALGDSFLGGFFGPAERVAASLHALADEGIERVQVSPFGDESFEELVPHIFATSAAPR